MKSKSVKVEAKPRGSNWTHVSKHKKRVYVGSYSYENANGERTFNLTAKLKNESLHNICFESHQAAKSLGWVKK